MLELDGEEEFLILACDGLWDEISPEAAAAIVRHQVVQDTSKDELLLLLILHFISYLHGI